MLSGFLLAAPRAARAADAQPALSLQDCLRLAVSKNPAVRSASHATATARAQHKSLRARYLPVLRAEANLALFNDEQTFSLPISNIIAPPGVNVQDPTIKVRDRLTYGASLTAVQPLIQLYKVYAAEHAGAAATQAADAAQTKVRRELEQKVVAAYLGALSAERLVETATAAQKQVQAYEAQVRDFLRAETVEPNALLKVQLQAAQIEKELLDAKQTARLMVTTLNVLMARPLDEPLKLRSDDPLLAAETENNSARQSKAALEQRPELRGARRHARQAFYAQRAVRGAMLPDLDAIFRYDHIGGAGPLQLKNSAFLGLRLSWNFWEWGASYQLLKAATARRAQAAARVELVHDSVILDLEAKRLEHDKALRAAKVAQAQLALAKENLRVEQQRFAQQQSTTTDLLSAQTLHRKAQNQAILARMAANAARFTLRLARGEDLLDAQTRRAAEQRR